MTGRIDRYADFICADGVIVKSLPILFDRIFEIADAPRFSSNNNFPID